MTSFVFITANDIHISDMAPRSRLDNFKDTILDKLSQMGKACEKLNADAALIAGDIYNLKNPARNSHRLNQELITIFKKFPCPIYVIEGNHDLTANNLDSLSDQPLGVLFADGTLKQLRHAEIEKDGKKVSLVGVPFTENLDLKTLKIPPRGDAITQICVMHIYAGIKSGMLFKERLYGYEELALLDPDIFILGHYHIDQGIYEHQGKHYVNIGSLSRGALSEEDIAHHPQIGFVKIQVNDDGKIEKILKSIKLKIRPAHEIFDLEKKAEEKIENQEMQVFVEKLVSETINKTTDQSQDINDYIGKMDLAKTVRDKVLYYIQEAKKPK